MKNLSLFSLFEPYIRFVHQNGEILGKEVMNKEVKRSEVEWGREMKNAKIWSKEAQTGLALEIEKSKGTIREVQRGDTLGSIVKGLMKEKFPGWKKTLEMRVDYKSTKIAENKPQTLNEANFIYPGQYVWIENNTIIVTDSLSEVTKVTQLDTQETNENNKENDKNAKENNNEKQEKEESLKDKSKTKKEKEDKDVDLQNEKGDENNDLSNKENEKISPNYYAYDLEGMVFKDQKEIDNLTVLYRKLQNKFIHKASVMEEFPFVLENEKIFFKEEVSKGHIVNKVAVTVQELTKEAPSVFTDNKGNIQRYVDYLNNVGFYQGWMWNKEIKKK